MRPINKMKARGRNLVDKNDIKRGILYCNTKVQLGEYLGINRGELRKYLNKFTGDDGRTLMQIFDEKIAKDGRGRAKSLDRDFLVDLLERGFLGNKMPAPLIKGKLLEEGYFPNKCNCCGFKGSRELDSKSPLLLHFKDDKRINWKRDNLEILCYNCYFLKVGDLMFKDQLEALEFWGIHKNKEKLNELSSALSLEMATEYKRELDEAQIEFEKSEDYADDIIAYKKFKK